jgi:hypothetical protein
LGGSGRQAILGSDVLSVNTNVGVTLALGLLSRNEDYYSNQRFADCFSRQTMALDQAKRRSVSRERYMQRPLPDVPHLEKET